MHNFKKQFKKLLKSIKINKEDIASDTIFIVVAILLFFCLYYFSKYFVNTLLIINVILLIVIFSVILIMAGYAVIKSLFVVSAELSLLIFLSQSYCAAPGHSIASDEALRSLLVVGVLYIVVSFLYSLYNALKKNYKYVKNERWSKEKIFTVFLYLFCLVIFIWYIYLVMNPIFLALCIYR